MSINSQKLLVGFLGIALFISVLTVGYVDAQRKKQEMALEPAKSLLDPQLEKGRQIYEKFSCITCHGVDGKSGAVNFNAQTEEKVPPVAFVKDSFTKEKLKLKILNGVNQSEKMDPDGPIPPLYMPAYRGLINETEIDELIDYLYSLEPKG